MKKVPFYSNTKDNTHCFQAVLKMILKYYHPNKDYTWEELDEMSGKKQGLWTWPQHSYVAMEKLGFQIKVISAFDYTKFGKYGFEYLKKEYGEEVAEEQKRNSDIEYEKENVQKLSQIIEKETRVPDLNDIISLLSTSYLITCGINSRKLAGKSGYAGHNVLIFESENDGFILHDPGLPPKESYKVGFNMFEQAWAYPDDKAKDIIAFRSDM